MNTDEIRKRFLKFFEERGHKIFPSDSLVPKDDPTLLFTSAGMNQFKEAFLGNTKGIRRAASCQKCLRTADLEKVGITPDHHTFFEMLGNFSFGDYFKEEAIQWAWEFLTEDLGLRKEDLWVSVYNQDLEAFKIWKERIRVPKERILKFDEKENFWPSNAPKDGPNGPCGPCSEIFFGGPDGIEVWNLVFTQFDRKDAGVLEDLPSKNIDTGMGLERIARVMQKKKTNFDIDIFVPIVEAIKEILGSKEVSQREIFAIADHIRAISFAICDGVMPSNEERGYVIRKLIRKSFWYGKNLGLKKPFLYKLVVVVARTMKESYPELLLRRENIAEIVLEEEKRFRNTLEEGMQRLSEILSDLKKRKEKILPAEQAFKLYDTYGFPIELTQEVSKKEGIEVELKGFEEALQVQRQASRQKTAIESTIFYRKEEGLADIGGLIKDIKKTEFLGYKATESSETIKAIIRENKRLETLNEGEEGYMLFDKTPFYGEEGGQVGDTGVLNTASSKAEVLDTKLFDKWLLHKAKVIKGVFKTGDEVHCKVEVQRRLDIARNHTATHLLQAALRKVLGLHVQQSGSLVEKDRLRFDFTHFKALEEEQVLRIEDIINEKIRRDDPVETEILNFEEAKRAGAIALFGEKYEEKVRVVSIGDYSKELCGGTHTKQTGEIGLFKIISESSIASGTRRIEALTGRACFEFLRQRDKLLKELSKKIKVSPEKLPEEIDEMLKENKELKSEIEASVFDGVKEKLKLLLLNTPETNGVKMIVSKLENLNIALLRESADILKKEANSGLIVLFSLKDDILSAVVGVTEDLNKKGLDAKAILDEIGNIAGIKGGGRKDLAQAGGRISIDLDNLVEKTKEIIEGFLPQ